MIEPSDAELSNLPEATSAYLLDLEQEAASLQWMIKRLLIALNDVSLKDPELINEAKELIGESK